MGFSPKSYCSLLFVMVLLPALCHSQDAYVSSRATFYGSPDSLGTPTGACGYGDYGRTVNDGSVSGVSRLYKNGTGCGACYQVRCKIPQLCIEDGVGVVVTDYGEGDKTEFVLSTRAFSRLARPNAALELFAYGVVDVEFRGIPCKYPGYNLMVKVHEHSRFPEYLAVVLLYQAGKKLHHCRGSVAGGLPAMEGYAKVLRCSLSSVIPSEWKAGAVYDTAIQLY
ncbi:expansin-like B1 [Actinidia rufa]|uniref:Expansin-like B1 n=1 Tax=Actinidia rufa TaxID=165716 RepID=A0A7J0FQU7_9ERIC|nr:expansin-like B1 [Actinidia rufa]